MILMRIRLVLMRNRLVKSKVITLVISVFALQVMCAQNSEPKDIPISPRYGEVDTKYMINYFTQTGSCDEYEDCIAFSEVEREKLIYYSILMADKYNCPEACYITYKTVMKMSRDFNYKISEELWFFVFSYLNKAAELENINALSELVSLYQKGNEYIQPDKEKVKFYKQIINEYWRRRK